MKSYKSPSIAKKNCVELLHFVEFCILSSLNWAINLRLTPIFRAHSKDHNIDISFSLLCYVLDIQHARMMRSNDMMTYVNAIYGPTQNWLIWHEDHHKRFNFYEMMMIIVPFKLYACFYRALLYGFINEIWMMNDCCCQQSQFLCVSSPASSSMWRPQSLESL